MPCGDLRYARSRGSLVETVRLAPGPGRMLPWCATRLAGYHRHVQRGVLSAMEEAVLWAYARSSRRLRGVVQGHAVAPSEVLSCLPCRAQRTTALATRSHGSDVLVVV
jgi:hypothetical protein